MKKNIIRSFIIISVICFVIIIALVLTKIPKGIKQNFQAFDEDLPPTYVLTKDDSILIKEHEKGKISVSEIRHSKVRGPVSVLTFDSLYWIYTYKIDLKDDVQLTKIFRQEIRSVDRSVGYTYNIIDNSSYYRFQYKAGSVNSASQIYFTISPDSLITAKNNDSILAYHALCRNLSIRYEEKDPIDIFVVGGNAGFAATQLIPMDILFLQRHNSLYFFL
jgi:hypothetical protein